MESILRDKINEAVDQKRLTVKQIAAKLGRKSQNIYQMLEGKQHIQIEQIPLLLELLNAELKIYFTEEEKAAIVRDDPPEYGNIKFVLKSDFDRMWDEKRKNEEFYQDLLINLAKKEKL